MKMLKINHHPDHASTELSTSLGSSSVSTELGNHWITDGSGNAIQHLHYLPFGEDWVDQRNSSWNAPYTFSGKEKDVETGYGYFGARYYDSGLSIWLSVDPMSDKYPNLSPYNYCSNSPVIYKDPDGRDKIEVGDDGRVSKITEQEGNDILVSKSGSSTTLSGHGVFQKSYFEKKNEDGRVTSTFFMGLSNSDAASIFSFMGENTKVEWGRMDAESDGQKFNLIGTDHNPNGESFVSSLLFSVPDGTNVLRYDHSHPDLPGTTGEPSTPKNVAPGGDPDVYVWQNMIAKHPNISLSIFYKGDFNRCVKNGVAVPYFNGFLDYPLPK